MFKEFTYQAIFQRDDNLISRDILEVPEIKAFYNKFGEYKDDFCLVAEVNNKIVGAVWTRILFEDVKGFGNIDQYTPEFAISLFKEYRGFGIGYSLMKNMIELLRKKEYKMASLSVQKDNYAVEMYKKVGFIVSKEKGEEYIMIYRFS